MAERVSPTARLIGTIETIDISRSCMSFTYNIPIVKENSRNTNSISKISFEACKTHAQYQANYLLSWFLLSTFTFARRVALSET